jgi:hypothetical protein
MDDASCVREFEKLAERLGIEIRRITGGPSGLCMVRGRRVLFLERELDDASALAAFSREFRGLNLEGMFVVPALRKHLGRDDGASDW